MVFQVSKSLLFLCFPTVIHSQVKKVDHGNQQWLQYYNQTGLSEKWALFFDGGFRWKEALRQRSQYIVRAGVGYRLGKNIRIGAGFAHLGFFQARRTKRLEYRPYQEFLMEQKSGALGLSHRFRLEERLFEYLLEEESADAPGFNFRFRYRIGVKIPLFKFPATLTEKNISLEVADEIFLNAGKGIIHNFFDQNRFMIGPVIDLGKNISVKITYNVQFASTALPAVFYDLDVFWLGFQHKIDLKNEH